MKKVLQILLILIIFLTTLILIRKNEPLTEKNGITFVCCNDSIYLSWEKLKKQRSETVKIDGKPIELINVNDLINKLKFSRKKWDKITFTSADGGETDFSKEEINTVFLSLVEKEKRYLRIVIPNAKFRQNWLKYVVKAKME